MNFLEKLQTGNKYESLGSGDKVRYMYLEKPNKYGLESIGFKYNYPNEFNDVFKVDFPITPTDYLTLDPSKGTAYLSIPAHFQNAAALKAKIKLLRVNNYLNLPQLYISDEDWEKKTYTELNERLNKYLAKIDGDLKFDISFTTKDGNRTSAHGVQTGQHTQS